MTLTELLKVPTIDVAKVAAHLDALAPQVRVQEVQALPASTLKPWFEASRGFLSLAVGDLVPETVPGEQPVRHIGINNMPAFRRFEKPMYRQAGGQVAGRNVQTWEWLVGPGYFTVEPSESGELVFDYVNLPSQAPQGWPKIKSNASGLSYVVFRGLRDVIRRVAQHVVIGEASRGQKPLNQFFVLVRQD